MNHQHRDQFFNYDDDDFFFNPSNSFREMNKMMRNTERMMESIHKQFFNPSINNNMLNHENNTDEESKHEEQKEPNYTYSTSYSSTFTNENGHKKSKMIREINKNGKSFREVVETDGDNKTVKRTGDESLCNHITDEHQTKTITL
jgi:hypothetical protein